MTRAELRHRKRVRKIQWAAAWAVAIMFEVLVSSAATATIGAIVIPIAYIERGEAAFGGEWLAIGLAFCLTYRNIHSWICDKVYGEEA